MGHCPFCKGAIQRELLVNGGTCPHCLIEIPGEEAATDPGEQAIARQQAEEAATRRRGPGLAAAVVLLALVAAGGGWLALRNAQPAVVELEEESFTPIPLDAHQNIFDEQPAAAGAQARAGGSNPATGGSAAVVASASLGSAGRGSSAGPATGGQVDPVAPAEPGRATLNPAAGSIAKQVEDVDPTAAASSPGGMVGPNITVGGRSAAETLTDPDAITEMIKRVVGRNSRQLQDCYNDRLKLAEDLEGRWRVGFEVQKNGSVSRIEVGGLGVADAELESCMTGRIASWRFSRIGNPQQVSKTYSFTR
ncbi:AgmX/PglI C-terminal domain-containing protein [Myxococcota bacterium]|nr:AgmX/PglI C-terminal domain-containing protein [Myxococcota bacterium]